MKQLVADSQKEDRVSEELALVVVRMATGIYDKWKFIGVEPDDAAQQCVLLVMRKLHRIDIKQNVFSYLTTIILNEYCSLYKRKLSYEKIKLEMLKPNWEADKNRKKWRKKRY